MRRIEGYIMNKDYELERLKALLAEKERLLAEKDEKLKEKDKKIQEQDEIIEKQKASIENMMQALLHSQKVMFGRKTEKAQYDGQLSLFDNDEKLAEQINKETEKITINTYKRTPRKAGVRKEMLDNLPKEVVEYVIDENQKCSVCGGELAVIGKVPVRTEVEFQPAKLIVKNIVRQVAKCKKCGANGKGNKNIEKAAVPEKILSHSIATPSLVAQIMYQKFAMGVPLNRQENDFYRMGLVLPRSNMAHWIIRCSDMWLTPIYERIHSNIIHNCEILHMDETRIQVNKEDGKKASSQSFMWVIKTGKCEEIKATFFYYSRTRSREIALTLLKGFEGYLTTDAYTAYDNMNLEKVQNNFCWAHLRRYFIESIPLDSKGNEIPGSKGDEGREFINLLFYMEEQMSGLTYDAKKARRQTASRKLLDAFWQWVEYTSTLNTTNEKLTKALNYSLNHREKLETFLEDGRLEISNNFCESHIRPFATARRAWLFADTPNGAKANAVLYTLVESARENNLNVYEYLDYLLATMPNIDFCNHPDLIDDILPWSDKLPERCHLVQKQKKSFKK